MINGDDNGEDGEEGEEGGGEGECAHLLTSRRHPGDDDGGDNDGDGDAGNEVREEKGVSGILPSLADAQVMMEAQVD